MEWQGRRVLITGHTGFKGAWLSLWLAKLGAEVTGLALAPQTEPSLFVAAGVASGLGSGLRSIVGDIRDPTVVHDAFREAQPEVVFHMAAQALVRPSYADPIGTYATNVMGTAHVLDAVRRCPSVRAVVIVTSDKCYENREWHWPYRETDTLGGYDPYSNSKACAELVTASFRSAFFHPDKFAEHGVAIATARAGNVIGGGDWSLDRLLPDAVRAFSSGASLEIRNPHAIRPWQHVLEPLRGYMVLAEALLGYGTKFTGAWNFGPQEDAVQPVTGVVNAAARAWPGSKWRVSPGPHPHEAGILRLDCSKARAELGWSGALRFEEAVDLASSWYRRFYAGEDARFISLEQIAHYEELTRSPGISARPEHSS